MGAVESTATTIDEERGLRAAVKAVLFEEPEFGSLKLKISEKKIMSHGSGCISVTKKRSTRALVAKFESRHGLEATLEVFYSKYFTNLIFSPLKIKKVCGF